MAVAGIYCRKCNTLIPAADVQAGRVVRVGRLLYCRVCSKDITAAAEDSKIIDIRSLKEETAIQRAVDVPPPPDDEEPPPPPPDEDAGEVPLPEEGATEEGAPEEAAAFEAAPAEEGAEAPVADEAAAAEAPAEGVDDLPLGEDEVPFVVIPPAQTGVKTRWIVVCAVIGVAIGAGVMWFVFARRPPPPAPPTRAPVVAQQPAKPADQPEEPEAPAPGDRSQLPLSVWAGQRKVQPPVQIFLVENPGQADEKREAKDLKDHFPLAGKYRLLFQKQGYEEHAADVDLTGTAPVPSLAEILDGLTWRATQDLQAKYADGKSKFEAGDFEGALAALQDAAALDREYPEGGPTVDDLLRKSQEGLQNIKEATDLRQKGQEALQWGDAAVVEEAAKGIEKRLGDGHEWAAALRGGLAEADRLAGEVARALETGDMEAAQAPLAKLQEISARSARVREFRDQIALFQTERERILEFLVSLGGAFDKNAPAAFDAVVDPSAADLLAALKESTARFLRAGGRFVSNDHELQGGIQFRQEGKQAEIRVRRRYTFKVGVGGKAVVGNPVDLIYRLVKVEDGWRLASLGE